MRLTRVEAWSLSFPLKTPYTVAYQTFDKAENIFVRLEASGGLCGFGCAAPDEFVTGETPAAALAALQETALPLVKGRDPLRPARIMALLNKHLSASPAALAAVDIALWDLLARKAGLPLWRMLGGYRDRIATSVTVGILGLDETVAWAREYAAQGFKALKLKGGLDLDSDVERTLAVRRALGPRIELRFDANQGYSVAQALAFAERTRPADVSLLEQPVGGKELEHLGQVTRKAHLPVMADESLVSLADAFRLARRGLVDMVNVKLVKVGGVTEALRVEAVAKAAGLDVMVGCMDDAGLGIAAALAVALSRRTITHADLDGHLDLLDDPTADAVRLRQGILFPSDRPGLGVSL